MRLVGMAEPLLFTSTVLGVNLCSTRPIVLRSPPNTLSSIPQWSSWLCYS